MVSRPLAGPRVGFLFFKHCICCVTMLYYHQKAHRLNTKELINLRAQLTMCPFLLTFAFCTIELYLKSTCQRRANRKLVPLTND